MKYRDWNEMQRKLEALYVLDNALTDPSEEYLRLIRRTEDGERLHYHVDNGAGDSLSVIFHQRKKGKRLFSFGMMENYIKIP